MRRSFILGGGAQCHPRTIWMLCPQISAQALPPGGGGGGASGRCLHEGVRLGSTRSPRGHSEEVPSAEQEPHKGPCPQASSLYNREHKCARVKLPPEVSCCGDSGGLNSHPSCTLTSYLLVNPSSGETSEPHRCDPEVSGGSPRCKGPGGPGNAQARQATWGGWGEQKHGGGRVGEKRGGAVTSWAAPLPRLYLPI